MSDGLTDSVVGLPPLGNYCNRINRFRDFASLARYVLGKYRASTDGDARNTRSGRKVQDGCLSGNRRAEGSNKMKTFQRSLLGLMLATASLPSLADLSVFTEKSTFLAQSGATSASGPLADIGKVAGNILAAGSVTVTLGSGATELFSGTGGVAAAVNQDWTARLPGADIAISGPENLEIALMDPVFSFGFDIVEPEFDPNLNAPFVDSSFTVTLSLGGVSVGSFSFNPDNDTAAFVGVWTDSPFDRVSIVETTAPSFGENEFFGQFFSGTVAFQPPPIPEPGTWAMLAGGLALLAMTRRRR